MQYSDGSLELIDRKWHTFTLDEAYLNRPYILTGKK
jgi:hypothetical protein